MEIQSSGSFQSRQINQDRLMPFSYLDISMSMRNVLDVQSVLPVIPFAMLWALIYENGTDLLTIKAILGHKSLNSTTIICILQPPHWCWLLSCSLHHSRTVKSSCFCKPKTTLQLVTYMLRRDTSRIMWKQKVSRSNTWHYSNPSYLETQTLFHRLKCRNQKNFQR